MPTLAELQTRMNGEDPNDALVAANVLTNYYDVYNNEYNALVQKKTEAELAIMAESSNSAGVDHSKILYLQSMAMGIESRMKVQDAKMIAFQTSMLPINPPTPNQVANVRQLTTQVAAMVARDQAIENIMVALGNVASIVDQIQGG